MTEAALLNLQLIWVNAQLLKLFEEWRLFSFSLLSSLLFITRKMGDSRPLPCYAQMV